MNMIVNFQPSFLGIKMYNVGRVKLTENFRIHKANSDEFCVSSKKSPGYCYNCTTEITSVKDNNDVLSYSLYDMEDGDVMYVDSMRTDKFIRDIGLGSCLHLTHVIEMLENGMQAIELQAASFAIPFHTRLGFKPINTWDVYLQRNLFLISHETDNRLAKYRDEAAYILNCNYNDDFKATYANQLIYDYMQQAVKIKPREELEKILSRPLNLRLSKNDVIKNKDFYNELFKKYKIDYEILD